MSRIASRGVNEYEYEYLGGNDRATKEKQKAKKKKKDNRNNTHMLPGLLSQCLSLICWIDTGNQC